MIFERTHSAIWDKIRRRKQSLINNNNMCKNSKYIKHTYWVGDKVLHHFWTLKNQKHKRPKRNLKLKRTDGNYTIESLGLRVKRETH